MSRTELASAVQTASRPLPTHSPKARSLSKINTVGRQAIQAGQARRLKPSLRSHQFTPSKKTPSKAPSFQKLFSSRSLNPTPLQFAANLAHQQTASSQDKAVKDASSSKEISAVSSASAKTEVTPLSTETAQLNQGLTKYPELREDIARLPNDPQTIKAEIEKSDQLANAAHDATEHAASKNEAKTNDEPFMRFFNLMARFISYNQSEANKLYKEIKSKIDAIDQLSTLSGKVSEPGAIDWSNDEKMKKLVDFVRSAGVDIPEGKYSWNEDEKKLLLDKIQAKKESINQLTQIQRTDMQRYFQQEAEYQQMRSNILKMREKVMDTIINNLRAH